MVAEILFVIIVKQLLRAEVVFLIICGPVISVRIATDYDLDGPRSYPDGDEIFHPS